jgi:RHS repeat-associated protein
MAMTAGRSHRTGVCGLAFCLFLSLILAFAFSGLGAVATQDWADKLHFSANPTESEIFNARVFDEPLIPVGVKSTPLENQALATALEAYAARTNYDDFSGLTDFLDRFPQSSWRNSLLLDLGAEYYNTGHYSKALDAWERAWENWKQSDDPKGKAQADRALGELARIYSKLGRMTQLSNLLDSVSSRSLTGPGTQLMHAAHQALWMMQHRPGVSFRCGPMALDSIQTQLTGHALSLDSAIMRSKSTTNGISLAELQHLASDAGMNYQAAFRSPGAAWIVPSVIHWKAGHYAALLQQDGDRFLVRDRTFRSSLWMTAAALEDEGSGYFLVPPGPLRPGWRAVSEAESGNVWGRGIDLSSTSGATTHADYYCARCVLGQAWDFLSSLLEGDSSGMTTYSFHTMLVDLSLDDTPVGYRPPVGFPVFFTATYNQYEANQPATFSYANLGPKWTCNWISYITDNPTNSGQSVSCYVPGGGTFTFSGFNTNNGAFAPETMTQGILTQASPSSYQMQFRNGSSWIFSLPDGSKGSARKIFLTSVVDSAGNAVTLHYDSSLRITNITDAIGQSTVLSYTNATFPYAITSVSDPFGRTAYFQYNSGGLLSQITDVLGLNSQYTYGAADFITALTTPYGTTSFSTGTADFGSWLQATDPLGETEYVESLVDAGAFTDPAVTVPTIMTITPQNENLNYVATYYWDKQAYQLAAGDFSQAKAYHFLFEDNSDTVISPVLMAEKEPLENRVWFNHPNQLSGGAIGPQGVNSISAVSRVLDDGFSQTSFYQYNALGNMTRSTDPVGRSFTYVYATNNIDLLQAFMTSNGRNELQGNVTYNSQHRPLTITDASGQTTTNTYNARGQILSTTDPLGETTTFAYDTNGYLLSITGPLQATNDVFHFTYDGFGRVQTSADTEGYTLTYAYDAFDRVTSVTHPDGTSEQFVYSNLDLVASADRLIRWTTNTYNADRQLVATQDPLGRITRFNYCNCGAVAALFDPAGNATLWDHDTQSRVTAKHYADGSTVTYTYENTTSRLHSRLDERGQETIYEYYDDDNLESVSYPNAIVATPTVTFSYDPNYNRVVSMQDGIGTTTYAYNSITANPGLGGGLLASVDGPLPNSLVTYQYDQLERVTSRAINGVAETAALDALGRPIIVTNALGTFQYAYAGATPRVASESYPNGQTNLYTYYNNAGDQRLLQIQHFYPTGALLSAHGYAYNAVGQITAWTNQWDALPTRVLFPSYDAVDQLTNVAVQGNGWQVTNFSYAYDSNGNRRRCATNGIESQFGYNALNQLVGSSATFSNINYEWDAENRLTAINQGTHRTEFRYDGRGRWLATTEKSNTVALGTVYFFWFEDGIGERRDPSGATTVARFYQQGEAIVGSSNNANYFYSKDHLGSVREALDSAGFLETRYDYSPFGNRTVLAEHFQTTIGYDGDFLHRASGLWLTWNRPLDSAMARWLARDSSGEAEGVNLYTFVDNDPIGEVDDLGLSAKKKPKNRVAKVAKAKNKPKPRTASGGSESCTIPMGNLGSILITGSSSQFSGKYKNAFSSVGVSESDNGLGLSSTVDYAGASLGISRETSGTTYTASEAIGSLSFRMTVGNSMPELNLGVTGDGVTGTVSKGAMGYGLGVNSKSGRLEVAVTAQALRNNWTANLALKWNFR